MSLYQYVRHKSVRRKGQALLEFALILPLLMVFILGIMEFAWLTRNQLTVNNATREAARTAALGKPTTEIASVIKNQTQTVPGSPSSLTITMRRDDNIASNGYNYNIALGDAAADEKGIIYNNAPSGAMIEITVSIPSRGLTAFFPFLNKRNISTTVVMRRES